MNIKSTSLKFTTTRLANGAIWGRENLIKIVRGHITK